MSGLDGQFASMASFSLSYSFSYGDNIGSTYEINNEDTTSSGTNPDTDGSDGKHETTNAAGVDDGEDHSTPVTENQENHHNVQDESVPPLEAQNSGRAPLSSGGLIALLTCIVAALVCVMFIIRNRKLNWMRSGVSSMLVSDAESSLSSTV
jgi:hypothetical protein